MKIAVISDIHANLEALTAVLDAVEAHGVDALYCLGDIVGYGADAAACVDLVRARCTASVRGNHDEAVAFGRNVGLLPRDAQKAVHHNREQLDDDQLAYLQQLPLTLEADGCTFVHASPHEPAAWRRLDSFLTVQKQFQHFDTDVCFIGHSHLPGILSNKLGVLFLRRGYRFLINVGSVGQPRDQNPQASFGIFDTDAFTCDLLRVPYDIERAAAKIVDAGLPRSLGDRLMVGR